MDYFRLDLLAWNCKPALTPRFMTDAVHTRRQPTAHGSQAPSVVGVFVTGILCSTWLTWWIAGSNAFYLLLPSAYVAVVLVHELGHAVAGLLSGFRVPFLYIGPVRVEWPKEGGMRLALNRRLGLWGGAVLVLPRKHPDRNALDVFRRRTIAVFAAGPGASILVGSAALGYSLFFPAASPRPYGQGLSWLQLLALMSLVIGVGQIVPLRIGNQRSDGLRILSLLRGRPGTDQTLLDAMVFANADGVRPRDWPLPEPGGLERITDLTTQMLIYYAFLDRGRHAEAWAVLGRTGNGNGGDRGVRAWQIVRDIERSYMRSVYVDDDAPDVRSADLPTSHRHISELSLARTRAASLIRRGELQEALRCADSVAHLRSLPTSSGLTKFNLSELDKILASATPH